MKLSVLMPVYNEKDTIDEIIKRVQSVPFEKEIIIVDDFSTDGTRDILKKYEPVNNVRLVYHSRNQGKGAAVRSAMAHVSGHVVIIQDAIWNICQLNMRIY